MQSNGPAAGTVRGALRDVARCWVLSDPLKKKPSRKWTRVRARVFLDYSPMRPKKEELRQRTTTGLRKGRQVLPEDASLLIEGRVFAHTLAQQQIRKLQNYEEKNSTSRASRHTHTHLQYPVRQSSLAILHAPSPRSPFSSRRSRHERLGVQAQACVDPLASRPTNAGRERCTHPVFWPPLPCY